MNDEVVFKFQQLYSDGSSTEVIFKEHDDINIYVFHDLCKRAAVAFGYLPVSVERGFGETNFDEAII